MKISDGIYRLIDKETNELVIQGTRGEISNVLNVTISYVDRLITAGHLKYKIYLVQNTYRYKNLVGSVSELATRFGVSYMYMYRRAQLAGSRLRACGYEADKRIYALYKGDDILTIGTAPEIIDGGWTTPSSFYKFLYKPNRGKNAKCVVLIED